MFTDIVAYSKMVEKREKQALQLLEEHNKILTPIIENNNGKIIKHIGDSIFAEFDNILNCTLYEWREHDDKLYSILSMKIMDKFKE